MTDGTNMMERSSSRSARGAAGRSGVLQRPPMNQKVAMLPSSSKVNAQSKTGRIHKSICSQGPGVTAAPDSNQGQMPVCHRSTSAQKERNSNEGKA
ncbi:MAG: hypothetical protein BWY09_00973 [Candidatus Hydrogenedentes bacterium ADurb.Bin179]|nr:MAG: hypothetical protein BWY09_00973 [Candidatus Hydrogenedentes bacterium ADurb.Bin179]